MKGWDRIGRLSRRSGPGNDGKHIVLGIEWFNLVSGDS